MTSELREWQVEAVNTFLDKGKGIVEASTGSGKTFVAIEIWNRLSTEYSNAICFIVVPSTNLMEQWYEELWKQGIKASRKGGGRNGKGLEKVNVIVVNTAREMLPLINLPNVLLVCDEAHRYFSEKNSRIFDTDYRWLLGLTATAPDEMGPFKKVIYRYTFDDGISDGIIHSIKMNNVGYTMAPSEAAEYDKYSRDKKQLENKLGLHSPAPELLNSIATKDEDPERRRLAVQLRELLFERKRALYQHQTRIDLTEKLVKDALSDGRRVLVVGESIPPAVELANHLHAFMEHSQMSRDDRTRSINRFKDGKTDLLVSVRTFQEGMNVPTIDCVVIMSSSAGERHLIQSIGRGVRPEGHPVTLVHRLFARGTTDETGTLNLIRSGVLDPKHIHIVDPDLQPITLANGKVPTKTELDLRSRYYKAKVYSLTIIGNNRWAFIKRKGGRDYYRFPHELWRILMEHDQWSGGRFGIEENGTVLIKGKGRKKQQYFEVGQWPDGPLKLDHEKRTRKLTDPLSDEEQEMMDFFDSFSKR